MRKKVSVPMRVFLVHMLICLFFSFDWPFLEGIHMGIVMTFVFLWGFTVPMVTAGVSVGSALVRFKKKEKLSILEIVTTVAGSLILLIYLASASGVLKNFSLSFLYLLVIIGTLFIWVCWGCKKVKERRRFI